MHLSEDIGLLTVFKDSFIINEIADFMIFMGGRLSMEKIIEVAYAAIAALGGAGVIFTAVIYFSSNFIAERLQKKYELKLNEQFEKYKAGIDNKTYISRTKFDAEFALYRSLSKAFFDMVKNVNVMIPYGYTKVIADKEKRREMDIKIYNITRDSVVVAQDELSSNAPFIPEKFFKSYDKIRELCSIQLGEFDKRWDAGFFAEQEEKETISMEAYKRTKEINEKFEQLNNEIREHLSKLDVLE